MLTANIAEKEQMLARAVELDGELHTVSKKFSDMQRERDFCILRYRDLLGLDLNEEEKKKMKELQDEFESKKV